MTQRIKEKCPACGGESFILDDDGYFICSYSECPSPGQAHNAIANFVSASEEGVIARLSDVIGRYDHEPLEK